MFEEMLTKRKWKTIKRKKIQSLSDELDRLYRPNGTFVIHIGTDGQQSGKSTIDYVTCVCALSIGKGGRVFYTEERKHVTSNLWEKLYNETMFSISTAAELSKILKYYENNIVVHVDANPDIRYASSDYVKALAGMVVSYGFRSVVKPDSWCASHAADHIVRNKNF